MVIKRVAMLITGYNPNKVLITVLTKSHHEPPSRGSIEA